MELEIKVHDAFCALLTFRINSIEADQADFVNNYDHAPDQAEEYGCADMRADILPATDEVLVKYGISPDEYSEIAKQVAEKVSFGWCEWCV